MPIIITTHLANEGAMQAAVKAIALEQKDGIHDYLYVEDVDGLLALVQMNSLEFHPWGAKAKTPEKASCRRRNSSHSGLLKSGPSAARVSCPSSCGRGGAAQPVLPASRSSPRSCRPCGEPAYTGTRHG